MKRKLMLALLSVALVSLSACGKNGEEYIDYAIPENYYVQDVDMSTNVVEYIYEDGSEIGFTLYEDENGTIWRQYENGETEQVIGSNTSSDGLPNYTYNVVDDVNKDIVVNMDQVSIDGHLISFPCDYDYIVETFGTLYYNEPSRYGNIHRDVDPEQECTYYEGLVDATTGIGTITFIFVADDMNTPEKLSTMQCKGFSVIAADYENNRLMTIALPRGITLGSTYQNITTEYGLPKKKESNDHGRDFNLYYKPDNSQTQYWLYGYEHGLQYIKVLYYR